MKAFPIASNLRTEGDEKENISMFLSKLRIITSNVGRKIGNNDSIEIFKFDR